MIRKSVRVQIFEECALNESGIDVVKCLRTVSSGRKVAGAIRFLVNSRGFQL